MPGRPGQGIPVSIDNDGECQDGEADDNVYKRNDVDDEIEDQAYRKITDSFHVSQKAISKYGAIEGCAACNVI